MPEGSWRSLTWKRRHDLSMLKMSKSFNDFNVNALLYFSGARPQPQRGRWQWWDFCTSNPAWALAAAAALRQHENSQLGDLILSETMWNPSERSEQLRNWWKACPSAITFGQSAPCLKNVTTSNISPAVSLKLLTVTYVFEICVDMSR